MPSRKTTTQSKRSPSADPRGAITYDPEQCLLTLVPRGLHTLIVGPRGCGKSRMAGRVGHALGWNVEIFHFGSMTDAEAFLQGRMTLQNAETSFDPARFVDAITTPRTLVVLDEFNRCEAENQNRLMSLLDDHRRMTLELADRSSQIVELASDVTFVATANVGSSYAGTSQIDLALRDRFLRIQMTFPPDELEILVAQGVPRRKAAPLLKAARALREQHDQGAVEDLITTRGLLRAGELVLLGFSVEEALLLNLSLYTDESVAAAVAVIRAEA